MNGIRRDRINVGRVPSVIPDGANLQRESGPIGLKGLAQVGAQLALVLLEKIVKRVCDGLYTPILHLLWDGLVQSSQFRDRGVPKIENDAFRRAANHDGRSLEQTRHIAIEAFHQIGPRDRTDFCDGIKVPHIAGRIGWITGEILKGVLAALGEVKKRWVWIRKIQSPREQARAKQFAPLGEDCFVVASTKPSFRCIEYGILSQRSVNLAFRLLRF